MRVRLHEPAVALTDLAIGIEAGIFALFLGRARRDDGRRSPEAIAARRWFVVFFGATSLAALAAPPSTACSRATRTPARLRLWRVSLGSIGVAGLSAWCLAAVLALPRAAATTVQRAMIAAHAAYLVALTRTNPPFSVAIATYIPGSLALGAALLRGLADPLVRVPSAIAAGRARLDVRCRRRPGPRGSPSIPACSTTTPRTTRSRRSRSPASTPRRAGSRGLSRPVAGSFRARTARREHDVEDDRIVRPVRRASVRTPSPRPRLDRQVQLGRVLVEVTDEPVARHEHRVRASERPPGQ